MTITYRDQITRDLTPAEVDANFRHVLDSANTTFLQSGIGVGTPISQSVQTALRRGFVTADFTGAAAGLTAWGTSALRANTTGANNTAFGGSALAANTSGYANTAVGYQAMQANTTGGSALNGGNTAIGAAAMISNTTGDNNTALGLDALFSNTDGYSNVAVGSNSIGFGDHGFQNVSVGWQSLFSAGVAATIGNSNTAIGTKALWTSNGSGNVALGAFAGYYETSSNAFYIDNQDRTNEATAKASSLMYGTFNSTPASQSLRINASLGIFGAADADGRLKVVVADGSSAGLLVQNGNNTASSGARIFMDVAGASAGDPYLLFQVQGVIAWSAGLDNSASDAFVISASGTLGTSNALSISTGGVVTIPNLAGAGSRTVVADANGVLSAP